MNAMIPLAYWCVLVAGLLPYTTLTLAKKPAIGYDNHNPRDTKLSGRAKRAYNAHLNGFEVFPLYTAGVVMALLAGAYPPYVNGLAMAWLVVRAIYLWAYLSDRASLRSMVWMAGMAIVIAIFTTPLWPAGLI